MTKRPDSAIGNASGWPEIDLSLLDAGRGTAGAAVDDVGQAPPATRQRTVGGSIRPVMAPEGGPADLRKLRKPNNMIRSAALPITNGLHHALGSVAGACDDLGLRLAQALHLFAEGLEGDVEAGDDENAQA
jgi:hypothetical protein